MATSCSSHIPICHCTACHSISLPLTLSLWNMQFFSLLLAIYNCKLLRRVAPTQQRPTPSISISWSSVSKPQPCTKFSWYFRCCCFETIFRIMYMYKNNWQIFCVLLLLLFVANTKKKKKNVLNHYLLRFICNPKEKRKEQSQQQQQPLK